MNKDTAILRLHEVKDHLVNMKQTQAASDLVEVMAWLRNKDESTPLAQLESTTDSDDMIRAQFVAAALAEAWGFPEFAVDANDAGDAVMAEFVKRREARNELG